MAVSIRRHAFGGTADLPLALDLIRAQPAATRHVIDFPWRLTAPGIASGRDAACWQDADGRVVGLAAWQQVWAAFDFYVLPGPDAAAVERAVFAWAGARFRERDAERGRPLPYSVEFRDDDQGRQALTAAPSGSSRPTRSGARRPGRSTSPERGGLLLTGSRGEWLWQPAAHYRPVATTAWSGLA